MNTISQHISRIAQAKQDIRNAIETMGVEVPHNLTIDQYAVFILMIGTSGGGSFQNLVTDYSIAPLVVQASESVGGGSKSGGLSSMPSMEFGSYFDEEFVTDYGIAS